MWKIYRTILKLYVFVFNKIHNKYGDYAYSLNIIASMTQILNMIYWPTNITATVTECFLIFYQYGQYVINKVSCV